MKRSSDLSCCSTDSPLDLSVPAVRKDSRPGAVRSEVDRVRTATAVRPRDADDERELSVTAGIVVWMALNGGC
ncbi:hypothetical protein AMJ57_02260 [Parcubacteria bacterium SG8_24]|nr:MAG: hypothetical protein AMJ57_02260 [Parcubacteria bacterium SG8_24]